MASPLVVQGTNTKDAYIYTGSGGVNNTGAMTTLATYSTTDYKSLLWADLSSIASNATITGATLELMFLSESGSASSRTHSLYRLRRNWGEGDNSSAAAAGTGEVNWNHALYSSVAWGTAGAANTTSDVESGTCANTVTINNGDTAATKTFTLTNSLVQEWVDGTFANNGVILVNGGTTGTCSWASREHATSSYWPKWTITYTEPGGTVPVHLLKSRYYPQGVIR
jgi:hypothetical protein